MSLRPYYQDDAVTLYHGDARGVLRALKEPYDAVLTDPPYGVDGGRGGDSREKAKAKYEANWIDDETLIREVVLPVLRLIEGPPTALTPGVRHLQLYPKATDIGCFWTPAAATHGPWGFTTFQPILYYGRDPRAGLGSWPSGKQLTEASEKNGHPCPKPIDAWRWLLQKVSATPGETILDPFVGSGTTLRAAKDLNRKAIGIEVEERYCEIAASRCAQEVIEWAI